MTVGINQTVEIFLFVAAGLCIGLMFFALELVYKFLTNMTSRHRNKIFFRRTWINVNCMPTSAMCGAFVSGESGRTRGQRRKNRVPGNVQE